MAYYDTSELNKRFARHVQRNWTMFERSEMAINCVYVFYSFDFDRIPQIDYVGSSKNLFKRYKSHKVKDLIEKNSTNMYVAFYIPIENNLEYEKKLIKRLQPFFN